jgi:hypothetical protein
MQLLVVATALLWIATASSHQISLPRTLPDALAVNDLTYTSCASANWPPSSVGQELVPQEPDAELQAALKEVDPERIKAIIVKLVSFGTRHTLSNQTDPNRGIGAARDWIASEYRRYAAASDGWMTVSTPNYTQGVASRIPFPVLITNVLATLKGSKDPDRIYVITGHYDSRVTDVLNYVDDAPGANDDASGVAGKSKQRSPRSPCLTPIPLQFPWSLLGSWQHAAQLRR